VMGAARSIGQLQPPGVEAHFIVAACENMISAKAFVPSDVVQASNGLTIEVVNTDAEGRLTLADALVYADVEVGCDAILELSTLTGGMLLALGWDLAGVFTDNDQFAEEIAAVSKFTHEKTWRMPVVPEYKEFLKSSIADVNHLGTRHGQSIQAMLFLQHFVNPDKPFAHVDMPGACWNNKQGVATGYGARLVTEWVTRQGKKEE
jgi:leucyl aminopeptidase